MALFSCYIPKGPHLHMPGLCTAEHPLLSLQ